MGKFVLIGGVTPPLSLDIIDEEIIRLTDNKKPKVLYVPTAGGDDPDYCDFFRGIYEKRFGCDLDILYLVRENPTEYEIKEKIFSSDVIYVEGGDTQRLMDYFKKYKMDEILLKAYKNGIVLVGKSAGALCWGSYYFEDEEANDFKNYIDIECLKFLNFIICPHYNMEGYSEKMDAMINMHGGVGIGIENNCALEIINDKYRIIASNCDSNAYKVYQNGTKICLEIIIKDSNFRSMKELIQIPS
ncbi:Type 1 glutamine amidotransferase-like domain-containing protein [Sporanaerobacter sp. PP17-6a]|uniref:Type 1 glutamine amidotransferase-like domain-containing protein n=1 Tax=Sporanaerobacter sp. PP17-6a TaxID=1891289 RepID=UPI0008A05A26|nr:peptidase E [Sporanaerobacter sp. PP17-6a]SCL83896.1 putative peptidase [Sporanaerobacter sp. PP17-6a]